MYLQLYIYNKYIIIIYKNNNYIYCNIIIIRYLGKGFNYI